MGASKSVAKGLVQFKTIPTQQVLDEYRKQDA